MKKISIVSIVISAVLCSLASISFAADKAVEKTAEPAIAAEAAEVSAPIEAQEKGRDIKQMSKGDIVSDIKETLDEYEEISNFVPGLKKITDRSGKVTYTFAGIKIEALDRTRLEKLYIRVRQEMTRLHTENINRQLDTARRIQRGGDMAVGGAQRSAIRTPATPRVPQALPVRNTIPQAPRPPAPPAQPTRR